MEKMKYEDFVKIGTIRKLPEIEKKAYILFHEKVWKEDLETARELLEKSPKWCVIAGHYAMHNLAKLFLAKKFNLKISGKFVHAATIEAIRKFLKDKTITQKFEESLDVIPLEEVPEFLESGKRERARSQYYYGRLKEITINNAREFLKEIVEPFIKTLVKLL